MAWAMAWWKLLCGVACRRAGRLIRTPHDGHSQFPDACERVRDPARCGPTAGAGGRVVRCAARGGPGSLGARDPRSAARWPAPGTKAARLSRRGIRTAGRQPRGVINLRDALEPMAWL